MKILNLLLHQELFLILYLTINYGKIVNIYIVYEINKNYYIRSYPKLENCLFGAVTLTKNVDID